MTSAHEIVQDLCSLGICEGMKLVVHSSLSSLGHVEGGADTVIDALLETIGSGGTLVMPTFTFPPAPIFDPKTTHSTTGFITETFRGRDGVIRSLHPTHSVAAFGPDAEYIIDGHVSASALGADSPLHRLALSGGYILLLGVQHTSNATVHVGEAVAQAPYLDLPYSDAFDVPMTIRLPDGSSKVVQPRENPGCSVNFNIIEEPLNKNGMIRYGKMGKADSQIMRGIDVVNTVVELMKNDPTVLLCDIDWCPFCLRARELIKG